MSDFLSEGYSLNDYASEGQLFYKPTDKIRFEGALEALCDSHRHVVIVTDDKVLAERYYRYFITRIAIRDNIILDTRAPTGADDVLNRFNKILSASTVESARTADNNDVHHVMAMVDTSNMSDHEWTVLGRLLKNFPGANIRMLAFVSESQLDVIDSVLNKLDGQVYRWILTSPTPEYLEALLEMGQQYNYQSETQQMAAAMGYRKRQQPKPDLVDELDALDAHLESLQSNKPPMSSPIETTQAPSKSDSDFDADLNALLGAIKQSHGIEDNQPSPATDENPDTEREQPSKQPQDGSTKTPSRRLIWATGITGVALILVALFAPWEQPEVAATQVQVSPRTFSTKTEPNTSQPVQQAPSVEAQRLQTKSANSVGESADINNSADEPLQVAELDSDAASQTNTEATLPSSAQWNDDMARILAAETGSASDKPESRAEDTQVSEPVNTDEFAGSDAAVIADTAEAEVNIIEPAAPSEVTEETANTVSRVDIEVSDSAEQVGLEDESVVEIGIGASTEQEDPENESSETDTPQSQSVVSSKPEPVNPADGSWVIRQAASSDYFIQLGVYANTTQALLFMDTLPDEAFAFQVRLNKSGRALSTVLSGPFASRAEAEARAASVLGGIDVWIRSATSVKAELSDKQSP